MKKIYFWSIVLLIIIGCKKEEEQFTALPDIIYWTQPPLFSCNTCFSILNLKPDEGFVIRTIEAYNQLADSLRIHPYNPAINCDTATMTPIDFSRFTLIGLPTSFGICDSISKTILTNAGQTKIAYTVHIKKYHGICGAVMVVSLNLVLIPKIRDKCTVYFKVVEE